MGGSPSNFGRNSVASANESLLSYLEENNTGEPYLLLHWIMAQQLLISLTRAHRLLF